MELEGRTGFAPRNPGPPSDPPNGKVLPPMTEPAIHCQSLVKTYGDKLAVAGIELTVEVGECFGLLGPNGAGKTTTF
jgi:ABC-2 type transport system ATP-binding protein